MNGVAVRALREALGISLRTLAKDIGRNAGYLSRVESGKDRPSPDTMVRIAKRLGVALDAITYVTEDAA